MEDFFFFNFTKSNTPPLVFSTFSKLCRWYQIAQRITLAETNPEFSIYFKTVTIIDYGILFKRML